MTDENTHLAPIADRLCCPRCRGQLRADASSLSCDACPAHFPIRDGVPLLAVQGTADSWEPQVQVDEDSSEYQQAYQEVDEAAAYNHAYRDEMLKRWSTRREYRLLDRLLSSQPRCESILDIPCGGGRLSPGIAPYTDLLIEADIAEGQVLYGSRSQNLETPQIWMTASAFHIPFADNSVDGTVCCRLCHHLPTPIERERLVRELLRVSRRFVIMTFFDYYSIKNWLRRIRRPFNKKPPKMTMTVGRVRELAREGGADLLQYPMLAPTSSGHRYALMVKN